MKFSSGNSKMNMLAKHLGFSKNQVVAFDLPAGFTCPAANLCLAYANRQTGKITDGKDAQFRCYASSTESAFPNSRHAHWHNYDALEACNGVYGMASAILAALPKNVKVVRVHASGDYYKRDYFDAWCLVAAVRPDVVFFGYTKILEYVQFEKPENFHLVYSFGGKFDAQVTTEPVSYVVTSEAEAVARGLPLGCAEAWSDYYLILNGQSFALVVHGTQKKGTKKSRQAKNLS